MCYDMGMKTYIVRHNGATYVIDSMEIHQAIEAMQYGTVIAHFRSRTEAELYMEFLTKELDKVHKG